MAARDDDGAGLGTARVLDGDEVQGVLTGAFYQAPPESGRMLKAERDQTAKAKPITARLQYDTKACGECKKPEWLCVCAAEKKKK